MFGSAAITCDVKNIVEVEEAFTTIAATAGHSKVPGARNGGSKHTLPKTDVERFAGLIPERAAASCVVVGSQGNHLEGRERLTVRIG